MIITRNDKPAGMLFDDLEVGDIFTSISNICIYVKTQESKVNDMVKNALCLNEKSRFVHFQQDEDIIKLDAELITKNMKVEE